MERIDSILAALFSAWSSLLEKLRNDEPALNPEIAFSDELERQLIARELHA